MNMIIDLSEAHTHTVNEEITHGTHPKLTQLKQKHYWAKTN